MFTPRERDLERGWPGRIDGDRVIQLAAQTLQAFFTGGGSAREHDVFPLADVVLSVPVLHPGAVRVFDDDSVQRDVVARIVREITGEEPRALRFLDTPGGLVAHLTLGLEGGSRLSDAHARASEIEERIRHAQPEISDVVVHTEP